MKRIRKTLQATEKGEPVLLHVNELIHDEVTVKTLHGKEIQVSIDDLIEHTTDHASKLIFKVGDKVLCKEREAIVVSRHKHDSDTPYRIQFDDGRQIQVSEDLISLGGKNG